MVRRVQARQPRRVGTWRGSFRLGEAVRAWNARRRKVVARLGSQGMERTASPGGARLGMDRHGTAAMASQGTSGHEAAWFGGQGMSRPGMTRPGKAVTKARLNMFKPEGFSKPVAIEISRITTRPASEVREEINQAAVEDYAEILDELGPIHVFRDKSGANDECHWLGDGYHRIKAHEKAGKTTIKACVKKGTFLDAYRHACHANDQHGVRITKQDKKRRLLRALELFPDATVTSQQEIADFCGVSRQMVTVHDNRIVEKLPAATDSKSKTKVKGRSASPKGGRPVGSRGKQKAVRERGALGVPVASLRRGPNPETLQDALKAALPATLNGDGTIEVKPVVFDPDKAFRAFKQYVLTLIDSMPEQHRIPFAERLSDLALDIRQSLAAAHEQPVLEARPN